MSTITAQQLLSTDRRSKTGGSTRSAQTVEFLLLVLSFPVPDRRLNFLSLCIISIFNEVGSSKLVNGFYWDDTWYAVSHRLPRTQLASQDGPCASNGVVANCLGRRRR